MPSSGYGVAYVLLMLLTFKKSISYFDYFSVQGRLMCRMLENMQEK